MLVKCHIPRKKQMSAKIPIPSATPSKKSSKRWGKRRPLRRTDTPLPIIRFASAIISSCPTCSRSRRNTKKAVLKFESMLRANGCPKGAIHMLPDREGFLHPTVTDACIQCGHCSHICPVLKQREPRPEPTAFAVWNEDESVRALSGSGGEKPSASSRAAILSNSRNSLMLVRSTPPVGRKRT